MPIKETATKETFWKIVRYTSLIFTIMVFILETGMPNRRLEKISKLLAELLMRSTYG